MDSTQEYRVDLRVTWDSIERDGYLDERAEREIRNRTWTMRDKIRGIFVDPFRPEGLVRIVVK